MNRLSILTLIFACVAAPLAAEAKRDGVEPFNRGIDDAPTVVYIPKGTMGLGISFSYTTLNLGKPGDAEDMGFSALASLVSGVKAAAHTLSVSPSFDYFIKDNVSLGARFNYGNTFLALESADLSLSEDMSFGIKDFNYESNSYSASFTVRDYIPIAGSKRFAVFIEGRLTGGYGQSKNYKLDEGLKHGAYTDIYKGSISMVPGLCVFVSDAVAFEVQVGVLGFSLQKRVETENQVKTSQMVTSNANFRINPLSIELGTAFYILDRAHRTAKKK